MSSENVRTSQILKLPMQTPHRWNTRNKTGQASQQMPPCPIPALHPQKSLKGCEGLRREQTSYIQVQAVCPQKGKIQTLEFSRSPVQRLHGAPWDATSKMSPTKQSRPHRGNTLFPPLRVCNSDNTCSVKWIRFLNNHYCNPSLSENISLQTNTWLTQDNTFWLKRF